MERYEVWSTVYGALEGSEEFDTLEDAHHAASALAEQYGALELAEWEVFLLPHYCDATDPDYECTCAQWLQDHNPVYSSTSSAS